MKQGGAKARHDLRNFGISNGLLGLFHLATGAICVLTVITSIILSDTGIRYLVLLILPAIGLPIIAFQHQTEDFENQSEE